MMRIAKTIICCPLFDVKCHCDKHWNWSYDDESNREEVVFPSKGTTCWKNDILVSLEVLDVVGIWNVDSIFSSD